MIGTAVVAAVGYAIADGLARACTYAEEVEAAEFCAAPSVHEAGSAPLTAALPQPRTPR